jgi:hypothetical protein
MTHPKLSSPVRSHAKDPIPLPLNDMPLLPQRPDQPPIDGWLQVYPVQQRDKKTWLA